MIKQILTTILIISSCSYVYGQTVYGGASAPSGAPSPSGGGNIVNVDMFTGTGSVNIPIYSYSLSGFNLGVSLNYNAKGIRVDDVASSVGLGWDLVAGGSVTRRVMGIEDEVTTPAKYTSTDYVEGQMVPGINTLNYNGANPTDDKEGDVFYFNLCGRQIEVKFYRDGSTLKYHTYPDADIKIDIITKDWNTNTSTFSNIRTGVQSGTGLTEFSDILTFNVTDEKGHKFYFERGDYKIKNFEYSNPLLIVSSGTYYPTTKWNLVKLETYTNYDVVFEYLSTELNYIESVSEVLGVKEEIIDPTTLNLTYDPLKITNNYWHGHKTHLSKIIYPNGKELTVHANNSNLQVTGNSVNVSRCDNRGDFIVEKVTIKSEFDNNVSSTLEYDFHYSYFNTPVTGYTATELSNNGNCYTLNANENHWNKGLRLKLNSIKRRGYDNNTVEDYYSFDYNSLALPLRLSPQKDFYGYYNAGTVTPHKRDNTHYQGTGQPQYEEFYLSIPYATSRIHPYTYITVPSSHANWGADRSYSFTNAQAFILNKITNALDGDIDIEYTNYTLTNPTNQYYYKEWNTSGGYTISNYIDPNLEAINENDGLCIGKVSFNNKYSTQHSSSIEYAYSGGLRFNKGGYTSYPNERSQSVWRTEYTNYFLGSGDFYNGSNHGFSEVTKTTKGHLGQELSKSKYYFSNLIYDDNGTSKTNMYRQTGADFHTNPSFLSKFRMGNLEKHETIENDAVTLLDVVVSNNLATYETYTYGAGLADLNTNTQLKGPNGYKYTTTPLISNEVSRIKTRTANINRGSNTATSVTTNSYDTKNNIKWTESTDSKGDAYRKYYMYNYDYYNLYAYSSISALSAMNTDDVQYLLSTGIWKMTGPLDSDRELYSLSLTAPLFSNGKLLFPATFTSTHDLPLSYTTVWPTNNQPSIIIDRGSAIGYQSNSNIGSEFENVSKITIFSANGLALETNANDKELYSSQIVDTKRGFTLANVSNAKYEDIAYNSFEVSEVDNNGNWYFDWSKRQYSPTSSMTGKYIYQLYYDDNTIESNTLNAKEYIVSFWCKTTNADPVIELVDFNNTTRSVMPTIQNSVGDWSLYTAEISPSPQENLTISNTDASSVIYIDELRLMPKTASMSTNTYEPLSGVSSTSNNSNYIIYNEYDVFGNLVKVKNMHGNILSKMEAVKQGADSN